MEDLDGDERDEIIASSSARPEGRSAAGVAYVLPGHTGTTDIDLAQTPEAARTRIIGGNDNAQLSGAVSAGDLTGDGRDELAVSVPRHEPAPTVFVIDGQTTGTIDLAQDEDASGVLFPIRADTPGQLGAALPMAGDYNGDGISDLAVPLGQISSPEGDTNRYSGVAVVFGRRTGHQPVDATDLGEDGYLIQSPPWYSTQNPQFGSAFSNAGDVNGDGRADLLIGSPVARSAISGGAAFLLYGQTATDTLDVATLTAERGARLYGTVGGGRLGTGVVALGDFGGTGAQHLLISSNGSSHKTALIVPLTPVDPPDPEDPDERHLEADWGFRESFRRYVYRGWANGTHHPITATRGATCETNPDTTVGGCDRRLRALSYDPPPARALRWSLAGASSTAGGDTTIATTGTSTFDFPGHFFRMAIHDPWFVVTGTTMTVRARMDLDIDPRYPGDDVRSADVRDTLGTFELDGPPTVTDEVVQYRTKPGAFSAEIADHLGHFLAPGSELDPVVVTIPRDLGPLPQEPQVPTDPKPDPDPDPDPRPTPTPPVDTGTTPLGPPADVAPPMGKRMVGATLTVKSGRRRVSRNTRRVLVATLKCRQGPCRVTIPKRVSVKIAGKRYRIAIPGVRKVHSGRTVRWYANVPRTALRRLKGKTTARLSARVVVRTPTGKVTRTSRLTLR